MTATELGLSALCIIIVNRNSGGALLNCLRSIEAADRGNVHVSEIMVVDDCSTDASLEGLDAIGLPVRLIRNETRSGYGASCNRAARCCQADYLLFLNSDTVLARDSIRVPLSYIQDRSHQDVGIVGIMLLDEDGRVNRSCARFPTPVTFLVKIFGLDRIFPSQFLSHQMKEWDHLASRDVDQVIGAFMLMRRRLFEQLGGYDERFFVYMEDLDLSLSVRAQGLKSVYLSSSHAVHVGGGTADTARAESLFFNLRSRIQYGFKHFDALSAIAVAAGTILVEPFTRMVLAAVRRSADEACDTLDAYAMLWRWVLLGRGRTCDRGAN